MTTPPMTIVTRKIKYKNIRFESQDSVEDFAKFLATTDSDDVLRFVDKHDRERWVKSGAIESFYKIKS